MTTLLRNENFILISVFATLTILSLWLQFVLLNPGEKSEEAKLTHDPDYYVENFTATGMDPDGIKYVLEAERLVHYPDDGSSLLDNPHVIQYESEQAPRHIYAESGWLSGDGKDILLTENVRVIQGKGDINAGGITTTRKLKLRLK